MRSTHHRLWILHYALILALQAAVITPVSGRAKTVEKAGDSQRLINLSMDSQESRIVELKTTPTPTSILFTISGNTGTGMTSVYYEPDGHTTSDENGDYSIAIPAGWSGAIYVDKPGYRFTPPYRNYFDVQHDFQDQDFIAEKMYIISGNVGMSGVILNFVESGRILTTYSYGSGYYSFVVPEHWSGEVIPVLEDYAFVPASRSYSDVQADQPLQDYTPIQTRMTMSGNVRHSDVTLSYIEDGVLKTVTSGSTGDYYFKVNSGWSGIVTPSKAGVMFDPANKSYQNVQSNQTGQNYKASIPVTTLADSGPGSLREAIDNSFYGDIITFHPDLAGQTITLASTLGIGKGLTIDGSGLNPRVEISGNGTVAIFGVDPRYDISGPRNVKFQSLVLKNGHRAISIGGGNIIIENTSFINNTSEDGGAIFSCCYNTSIKITSSEFISNAAENYGGAISVNFGKLAIQSSTFTDNIAGSVGGAISIERGGPLLFEDNIFINNRGLSGGAFRFESVEDPVIVRRNLFSGNKASLNGGAIFQLFADSDATFTIENNTFFGNEAGESGGGLVLGYGATLRNNTFSHNKAAPQRGGSVALGFANLYNNILANNTGGGECYVSSPNAVRGGNNLIEDGSVNCAATITGDPRLDTLAANGGLTNTMALLPDSPAVDTGDTGNCPLTDQRWVSRPQGDGCDIGAFEYISPLLPTQTVTASPTNLPVNTVTPRSIQILQPNGGEVLSVGSTYRITWNSTPGIDTVSIAYATCDSCRNWITSDLPNVGYYDWNVLVGTTGITNFKIYIIGYDTDTGSTSDISDNYFTVTIPASTPTPTVNIWTPATFTRTSTPTRTPTRAPTNTVTFTPTRTSTATGTPSITPTFNPTTTPSPTSSLTPTITMTPISNCNEVYHGALTLDGGTDMSIRITNQTGIPLAVQEIFVVWNHDRGHLLGPDKTLHLRQASLDEYFFWTGDVSGPYYTIRPVNISLPTGDSILRFTFHQTYDHLSDGSEEFRIVLGTNGCQNYPIHYSGGAMTATRTSTPPTWVPGTSTHTPTMYTWTPVTLTFTPTATPTRTQTATPTRTLTPTPSPTITLTPGKVGIDVRTGAEARGNYSILQRQALRASYAGVNDGPVQIMSTTNNGIVGSESSTYSFKGTPVSFSEMMGLPDRQLDTTYWLPWYNNVDLDTQLRIGNVSNQTAHMDIFIAGILKTQTPITLAPGESIRQSFAGVNDGPVHIVSDANIVASQRVIYKVNGVDTSFSEMMALPNDQLDNVYWLPWYNNVDLDTQLRVANISVSTATVYVYVDGQQVTGSPITLWPGDSVRKNFAGINAGPMKIVSTQNILVTERVIYKVNGVNTSFSEMMALPNNQLSTKYWFPWYNNVGLDTQLRFANVSNSQATMRVFIGEKEMTGSPFTLPAWGSTLRQNFAGISNGPVRVESNTEILVSERVIYKLNGTPVSFSEMIGLPEHLLDVLYWFPWYNNVDLSTQLRFGVP